MAGLRAARHSPPFRRFHADQTPRLRAAGPVSRSSVFRQRARAACAHRFGISGPAGADAARRRGRYDRDFWLRADRAARASAERAEEAQESPGGRAFGRATRGTEAGECRRGNVALLRRSARAGASPDGVVDDAGRAAAALRDLLRWRARHHGGCQPRRGGGRRKIDWAEHRAAARAVAQRLYQSRTEFYVPLFFYAQIVVRAAGESADRFSRRIRHNGRALGDAHVDADRQAAAAEYYSDLWTRVLGQGAQLE